MLETLCIMSKQSVTAVGKKGKVVWLLDVVCWNVVGLVGTLVW